MNSTEQEIKKVCQKLNIKPSKLLGQNFLIDKNVLEKIIQAGEISKDDLVLEIGPGLGILTRELVKHAGYVVAVEKDRRLAEYLRTSTENTKTQKHENTKANLEVVNDDVLKLDLGSQLLSQDPSSRPSGTRDKLKKYKIIANLPYSISTQVLWKFLHYDAIGSNMAPVGKLEPTIGRATRPELMVLMFQKEVGERICASQGEMSILSVLCQFYAECEIVTQVSKDCFWPVPEVESVIVKLKTRNSKFETQNPKLGIKEEDTKLDEREFFRMVKIGFAARRKMLKNNLSAGYKLPVEKIARILENLRINQKIRAQELTVPDWRKIFDRLREISYN